MCMYMHVYVNACNFASICTKAQCVHVCINLCSHVHRYTMNVYVHASAVKICFLKFHSFSFFFSFFKLLTVDDQ